MIECFDKLTKIIEESEFYYIYEMDYDLISSTLELSLCENPDHIESGLSVLFAEIEGLSNKRYHDPGDICVAEIQSYDFRELDGKVLVIINTGDSNLEFLTSIQPNINEITKT